jgi:hypothetical protein
MFLPARKAVDVRWEVVYGMEMDSYKSQISDGVLAQK